MALAGLPQVSLGGWGLVAWVVGGLLVAGWLLRRVRRMVGSMIRRRVLTMLIAAVWAGGVPVTMDIGGMLGQDASTCQQVSAQHLEFKTAPAQLVCSIKARISGLGDAVDPNGQG